MERREDIQKMSQEDSDVNKGIIVISVTGAAVQIGDRTVNRYCLFPFSFLPLLHEKHEGNYLENSCSIG